jgi:hypothetical protein
MAGVEAPWPGYGELAGQGGQGRGKGIGAGGVAVGVQLGVC